MAETNLNNMINTTLSKLLEESQKISVINELNKLVSTNKSIETNKKVIPVDLDALYNEITRTLQYLQQLVQLQNKYTTVEITTEEPINENKSALMLNHVKLNFISNINVDAEKRVIKIYLKNYSMNFVSPSTYSIVHEIQKIDNFEDVPLDKYDGFNLWTSIPLLSGNIDMSLNNTSEVNFTMDMTSTMKSLENFHPNTSTFIYELILFLQTVGMSIFPAQSIKLLKVLITFTREGVDNIEKLYDRIYDVVCDIQESSLNKVAVKLVNVLLNYIKQRINTFSAHTERNILGLNNITNNTYRKNTICPHPHSTNSHVEECTDDVITYDIANSSCLGGNAFTSLFSKFASDSQEYHLLYEGIDKLLEWVSSYNLSDAYHSSVYKYMYNNKQYILPSYYYSLNKSHLRDLIEAFSTNDITTIVDTYIQILSTPDILPNILFIPLISENRGSHVSTTLSINDSNLISSEADGDNSVSLPIIMNYVGIFYLNLANRIIHCMLSSINLQAYAEKASPQLDIMYNYLLDVVSRGSNVLNSTDLNTYGYGYLDVDNDISLDSLLNYISNDNISIGENCTPVLGLSLTSSELYHDNVLSSTQREIIHTIATNFTEKLKALIPTENLTDIHYIYSNLNFSEFNNPSLIQQIFRDIWLANKISVNFFGVLNTCRVTLQTYNVTDHSRSLDITRIALNKFEAQYKLELGSLQTDTRNVYTSLDIIAKEFTEAFYSSYNIQYINELYDMTTDIHTFKPQLLDNFRTKFRNSLIKFLVRELIRIRNILVGGNLYTDSNTFQSNMNDMFEAAKGFIKTYSQHNLFFSSYINLISPKYIDYLKMQADTTTIFNRLYNLCFEYCADEECVKKLVTDDDDNLVEFLTDFLLKGTYLEDVRSLITDSELIYITPFNKEANILNTYLNMQDIIHTAMTSQQDSFNDIVGNQILAFIRFTVWFSDISKSNRQKKHTTKNLINKAIELATKHTIPDTDWVKRVLHGLFRTFK